VELKVTLAPQQQLLEEKFILLKIHAVSFNKNPQLN